MLLGCLPVSPIHPPVPRGTPPARPRAGGVPARLIWRGRGLAQGFVSNRDSERNEDRADPLEIVLYAVFVATSARASVAELAEILQARPLCAPSGCALGARAAGGAPAHVSPWEGFVPSALQLHAVQRRLHAAACLSSPSQSSMQTQGWKLSFHAECLHRSAP